MSTNSINPAPPSTILPGSRFPSCSFILSKSIIYTAEPTPPILPKPAGNTATYLSSSIVAPTGSLNILGVAQVSPNRL